MAVIVSNGATNLSTANGFYRVESHNLSGYSGTQLVLNTARSIAVTFANAGSCQGVIIALATSTATSDVTVTLKESGVVRATKTLTASAIINGTSSSFGVWITPFIFTTPYTVDTVAAKWTFEITASSYAAPQWVLQTSNGTAPFYATWCDNAVTFADYDTVICKDIVTVSSSAKFKGTLGTGDSTNAPAIIVCKSATPPTKTNNVSNLQIIPSAPMTFEWDGLICWGSHSSIQAGTSTTPVPVSNRLTMRWIPPTVGTQHGFYPISIYGAPRGSFLLYGDYPATERYYYSANAVVGNSYFDVTNSTGIVIGDEFILGNYNVNANTVFTTHTVTGVVGNRVSVTPNIASYDRMVGTIGIAYKISGRSIILTKTSTDSGARAQFGCPSNFVLQGVDFMRGVNTNQSLTTSAGALSQSGEDASYRSKYYIGHCVVAPSNSSQSALMGGHTPTDGILQEYVIAINANACLSFQQTDDWHALGTDMTIEERFNYQSSGYSAGRTIALNGLPIFNTHDNIYENTAQGIVRGKNCIFKNNYIKGGSGGGWQLGLQGYVNCNEWSGNVWDSCPTGIQIYDTNINVHIKDTQVWNFSTYAISNSFIYARPGSNLINFSIENNTNITKIIAPSRNIVIEGSNINMVNDGSTNNDWTWFRTGTIQRTGIGLTDTTVRTAGGYALRFDPNSSTDPMHWDQIVPTGNIQSKTMTVSVWVNINNSAYYAGVHTKPTLAVVYDNATTVTSVATGSTGWQILACTFTPTTTYGQITITVRGATDATGVNRYFYVDDMNIAYPAGVAINLGGLDLWANGLPVTPAIATVPSLGGVWDEPLNVHQIAGSAGKMLKDANDNAELAAIK